MKMSHLNQMLKWKMVKPLNERFDNMWSFQCDIPFCSSKIHQEVGPRTPVVSSATMTGSEIPIVCGRDQASISKTGLVSRVCIKSKPRRYLKPLPCIRRTIVSIT